MTSPILPGWTEVGALAKCHLITLALPLGMPVLIVSEGRHHGGWLYVPNAWAGLCFACTRTGKGFSGPRCRAVRWVAALALRFTPAACWHLARMGHLPGEDVLWGGGA